MYTAYHFAQTTIDIPIPPHRILAALDYEEKTQMGHTHHSHPDIIKRLKRANGHLQKIIEMIEGREPCLDVAQQLQAVYKAIGNAKGVFVQDHIEGCLTGEEDSPTELKQKMREIKEISKYL